MKHTIICLTLLAALLAARCTKEAHPTASENPGIAAMFSPGADAAPEVLRMFNEYGVWVRDTFTSIVELTNGYLEVDNVVRARGAQPLDPALKEEVIAYSADLLANVSSAFSRAFFPLEIVYVQSYGVNWWVYPLKRLGRSRLIISWPNTTAGTIPVTDPANHYYQDSVLTLGVWNLIGPAIAARFDEPLAEFVAAGKAYDNGKAYDQIYNAYQSDGDAEKYAAALDELTRDGGFLSGNGSRDFRSDFAEWIRLVATESHENIRARYLDNSPARAAKYDVLVRFARQYEWDIQAAGNAFRAGHEAYKASL
ncbi:MAG: hypothetical protein LBP56_03750 [Odoribacteraceae bacterium]|jgi:hypothetical protein|nr:hypothetical protein [Odoribacteraceae bacterium]